MASTPKSALARHRLLAPNASVFVSPICLGSMNFGDAWKENMGECNKETSFGMLDFFYEQGGNFIDTANGYQDEQSEQWLGEWLAKYEGRRDEMVIATKYTANYKTQSEPHRVQSNFGGNGAKSLHVSVDRSLKKLQTSYIDLLYVHFWEMTTSIPELMHSLNNLVVAGKVIYLGISDTPAWIVSKANEYARQNGLRPFSVYQGRWSAAMRDFEREIIPMTKEEGMALCPWGVLGGGSFKPSSTEKEGGRNMPSIYGGERDKEVSKVLEKIANAKGTSITSVALAYCYHKTPYVFPILGGRKIDHLKGNIEALSLSLSEEDMKNIESAYPFEVGFPHDFLGGGKPAQGPQDVPFIARRGQYDFVINGKPIVPSS